MSAPPALCLVRHAQPDVPEGLCYGRSDVLALPEATAQAARALAEVLPFHARVWVSGLRRAQQLAAAVAALRPDLAPAQIHPGLNEMDFGCFEMSPWADIPVAAFDAWLADFAHHRFGGRQSVAEFLQQVDGALAQAQPLLKQGPLVWFTHAGVLRALSWRTQHAQPPARADLWPSVDCPFGGYWLWPGSTPSAKLQKTAPMGSG